MIKRIKIFKSATNKSILDVQSALDYYTTNKNNEEVYKGNIVFTINEYGQSGKQLQAFVQKATTKMVLNAIKNHNFPRLFPNGFADYGGTIATKRARIFKINFDAQKSRYIFQIDEGVGAPMRNGAIRMAKREQSVMTFITYQNTLELAHEVLDFIKQAEIMAMFNGKPLYTIMPNFS